MKELSISEYLNNPCGACANAYWKNAAFQKPDNVQIFHEKDINNLDLSLYEVMRYFRLLHNLKNISVPDPNDGCAFITVNKETQKDLVAEIINKCYGANFSVQTVEAWTNYKVFDNDLWIIAVEKNIGEPLALGIADFDREIGEGSLEWIQVLPKYQKLGFGKAVVNELLRRLSVKAKFVTVSGRSDNPANPEKLYRSCGFNGNDIWYVLTPKKN